MTGAQRIMTPKEKEPSPSLAFTEEEWTPEFIRKRFGHKTGMLKIKRICAAHNASLASLRQRLKGEEQESGEAAALTPMGVASEETDLAGMWEPCCEVATGSCIHHAARIALSRRGEL